MGFVHAAILRRGFDSVKVGLLFVVCLALAACGGGGGGGGSPGSGGSLAIAPTSLQFVAAPGGAFPPSQTITATFSETNVAQVVAGWPANTIPPTWLSLAPGGSNISPVTFSVFPITTALAPGTYNATVVIGTGTSNGNIISIRNASVTYQVGSITIAPSSSVIFNSTAGLPLSGTVSISSSKGTAGWTISPVTYSGPIVGSWLHLSFSGPNLPATLTLNVDGLVAGNYSATVDISDGTFSATLSVTYNVI